MPELTRSRNCQRSLVKMILTAKIIRKVIISNKSLTFKIPLNFEKLLKNKIIKKFLEDFLNI